MEKFETRCDYDIFIKKEKERKISCADMDEYGSVKNKWRGSWQWRDSRIA